MPSIHSHIDFLKFVEYGKYRIFPDLPVLTLLLKTHYPEVVGVQVDYRYIIIPLPSF